MAHAEGTALVGGVTAPPSPEAIRAQLDRIQASADFDVPDRAHKFLGYVVEETLAGRADRIKAYSIALEVFGRDSSFDAQADPVVRIEAGRVRRALERYYLTAGQPDEIVITIPKGGYVPLFDRRARSEDASARHRAGSSRACTHGGRQLPRWASIRAAMRGRGAGCRRSDRLELPRPGRCAAGRRRQAASQPDIPRLLIEPFEDLTGTESSAIITRGLTEEIIGQIAKFKDLQIIEVPFASAKAVAEINPASSGPLRSSRQRQDCRRHASPDGTPSPSSMTTRSCGRRTTMRTSRYREYSRSRRTSPARSRPRSRSHMA